MEIFDFIKTIFSNSSNYSSISNSEKRKYYFISQRRFAIQYPMQANVLQHLKINQVAVMDFWHIFLSKQHKYMPNWIYTKGIKKTQQIKEKKNNVSNETIKEYCKAFNIDNKSVYDALEFYNEEMTKELNHFENILKQK